MALLQRALHLRSGEPHAAERIDVWLREHEVEIDHAADAYEACVHLLTRSSDVAGLVVVGTDWLAPDEWSVLAYIREVWPGTAIILYGTAADSAPSDPAQLTLVCRTESALERTLGHAPVRVLEQIYNRAGARLKVRYPRAGHSSQEDDFGSEEHDPSEAARPSRNPAQDRRRD